MKLEAVDRKNPHFICPATIGEVRGSEVLITFDGWRGAFDYWCRYDSRDIFPVGWCSLTGDNLQPPGTKGKAHVVLLAVLLLHSALKEQPSRQRPAARTPGCPVWFLCCFMCGEGTGDQTYSTETAWHQGAEEWLSIKVGRMMALGRDGAVQRC